MVSMAKGRRRGGRNRSYAKREERKPTTSTALDKQAWGPVKTAATTTITTGLSAWKGCKAEHNGTVFALDNGLTILASGYRDSLRGKRPEIDLGFYLDDDWAKRVRTPLMTAGLDYPAMGDAVPVVMYPWPDYGKPEVTLRNFDATVRWLMQKIEAGDVVETGCYGGHGRTGTLLACLLVKQGHEAGSAISRVRLTYCDWAIESDSQEHFIRAYHAHLNGLPAPPRPTGHGIKSTPLDSLSWNSGTGLSSLEKIAKAEDDAAEYQSWQELNRMHNTSAPAPKRDVYHDEGWDDFMHSEGVPLPDDWYYMDDDEIEQHLAKYGYRVLDLEPTIEAVHCEEPPCPHPAGCGDGECLRAFITEMREDMP